MDTDTRYARVNSRTDGYMWVRRDTASAFYATQQVDGNRIAEFRHGPDDGSTIFQFKAVETSYHAFMTAGKVALKGLNGTTVQAQFRNTADTAYVEVVGSAFTTASRREWKKNIADYVQNALDKIMTTPVHEYHMLTDKDAELKRIGLIYDEIPYEIASISGEGVDLYAMCSVLWKAVQELKYEIDYLKSEKGVA
jgi:hypothetical protein